MLKSSTVTPLQSLGILFLGFVWLPDADPSYDRKRRPVQAFRTFRKHAQWILILNAVGLIHMYVSLALVDYHALQEFLPDGWQAKIFPPTSVPSVLWAWGKALLAPLGLIVISMKLVRVMDADKKSKA